MPRFNYTGRKKISKGDTAITLIPNEKGPWAFEADLRLKDYGFPETAVIFVEAYRQTKWMRFNFGTINQLTVLDKCELTEFDSPEGILFRVKIASSEEKSGCLIAHADRIHPKNSQEEDPDPLLPVRAEDLDEEVWRLDVTQPVLLINRKMGDFRSIANSREFISLVYPTVLRQMLEYILIREKHSDIDDDEPKSQWLRFSMNLAGDELPSIDDVPMIDNWIEDAVQAFARRLRSCTSFLEYLDGGEKL